MFATMDESLLKRNHCVQLSQTEPLANCHHSIQLCVKECCSLLCFIYLIYLHLVSFIQIDGLAEIKTFFQETQKAHRKTDKDNSTDILYMITINKKVVADRQIQLFKCL